MDTQRFTLPQAISGETTPVPDWNTLVIRVKRSPFVYALKIMGCIGAHHEDGTGLVGIVGGRGADGGKRA